ncbi:MAG: threonine ammonia-lyase [Peptococcales bacterium]|jgi:threonine dehydratase
MFTKEDFIDVKSRIKPFIHETQIMYSQSLSEITGNKIFVKPECLQKTGSFKIRGAASKVTSLSQKEVSGLVTASSGNHGQAVAYMAKAYNLKARIVIPNTAPQAKITAIRAYGAEIEMVGPKSSERLEMAERISQEMGYLYIPPYDDYDVIKGQGSIGLELIKWQQPIDKVFVPIGGGGLLSGIACCLKTFNPKIQVIGVEPKQSSCMYTSRKTGTRQEISPNTIADGLRTVMPGKLTFPLVQKYVDDLVLVEEEEIKQAMKLVMERMKLVIEPSGAVSIAAMLKEANKGLNLVGIISGGNLDIMEIPEILRS